MAMDFGIIVDTSASVGKDNILEIRKLLALLIHDFQISERETHIALVTYSTYPKLQFSFNKYYNSYSMVHHVHTMKVLIGGTRTDRAIELAIQEMFTNTAGYRPDVPNVLMVITDGRTNPGSKPYDQVLQPLKDIGVTTIAVGVGSKTKHNELFEIAMDKEANVIHMDSYVKLKERLNSMMGEICASLRAQFSEQQPGK